MSKSVKSILKLCDTRETSENKSLEGSDDLNDFRMEEDFFEDGDQKENVENIIQKLNVSKNNKEYKIFTSNFDEIEKAENLEKDDEIKKLRNNLDQQLTSFQDVITKLANKLQRQLLARQNRSWEYDLEEGLFCLLYTSPSPRDVEESRMPSSA